MAADSSFLENRLDRASLPLAVGDVIALIVVLTLGTMRHVGADVVTTDPAYVAVTLVPWLVGWAIAAPVVGAYSAGAAESAKAAIPLAIRAWLPANLLAIGIRAMLQGGTPTSLAILFAVTFLAGAAALAAWRYLYFQVR